MSKSETWPEEVARLEAERDKLRRVVALQDEYISGYKLGFHKREAVIDELREARAALSSSDSGEPSVSA